MEAPIRECRRCGTCCTKGGPALHREDEPLIREGVLSFQHIFTLREGEPVHDNVRGCLVPLTGELVKIRSQQGGATCLFYDIDKRSCGIYSSRPLECRLLKCWDTRDIENAFEKNRLSRKDLLSEKHNILNLIHAHDTRCGHGLLASLVRQLSTPGGDEAVQRILDMLQYDHYMRPFLVQKAAIDEQTLDFLFGRPLSQSIRAYGLEIEKKDNQFLLKRVASVSS